MHCVWLPDVAEEEMVWLPESEVHHVVHVLRATVGTPVRFTNGAGVTGTAEIAEISKKACRVRVLTRVQHQRTHPEIHIAFGVLHNADRLQFVMEKLTELGVHRITPLITEHTERRQFNHEKAKAHMIAAIKQSGHAFLPDLTDLVKFLQWIPQVPADMQKCIAHCHVPALPPLPATIDTNRPVCLLIGPEGDFSPDEVRVATQAGFTEVSLGNAVLRAETAAMAAVIMIQTKHLLHV